MELNYRELLPEDFNSNSRVWIYQSSRLFSNGEAMQTEELLKQFVYSWKSHGTPVQGFATLLFNQFIVLMADETATGVSGCSTDSSVRLIKDLEQIFKVQLFDRQTLAFVINEKIQLLPLSQLKHAAENNFITAGTLYFNNTVLTKEEMLNNWIIPIKESWLSKRVTFTQLAQ